MAFDATVDPRREKLDRLLLVADSLENPPKGLTYDQKSWKCGTHACAIGHALVKYGGIGGMRFVDPSELPQQSEDHKASQVTVDNGFNEVFGLTFEEFLEYFGPAGPKSLDRALLGEERALAMAAAVRALHARKVAELVTA